MKEKIYVGKNLEEIEKLAVEELGVAKEYLYFDVTSEEREEIQVHVMVDVNPVKVGKEYIEAYLRESDIYGFVERKMRDNVVEYDVNSEDANAVLIGHNAQTLSALHISIPFCKHRSMPFPAMQIWEMQSFPKTARILPDLYSTKN